MVEPLRHRQTKGAETDMLSLTPPRHASTLPRLCENSDESSAMPIFVNFSSILSDQRRANRQKSC